MDEKVKQLKTYLSQYRNAVTHDRAVQVRDLIENMFLDELDRNEIAEAEIERLRAAGDTLAEYVELLAEHCDVITESELKEADYAIVVWEALKGGE